VLSNLERTYRKRPAPFCRDLKLVPVPLLASAKAGRIFLLHRKKKYKERGKEGEQCKLSREEWWIQQK
jgi:hypothetical protein